MHTIKKAIYVVELFYRLAWRQILLLNLLLAIFVATANIFFVLWLPDVYHIYSLGSAILYPFQGSTLNMFDLPWLVFSTVNLMSVILALGKYTQLSPVFTLRIASIGAECTARVIFAIICMLFSFTALAAGALFACLMLSTPLSLTSALPLINDTLAPGFAGQISAQIVLFVLGLIFLQLLLSAIIYCCLDAVLGSTRAMFISFLRLIYLNAAVGWFSNASWCQLARLAHFGGTVSVTLQIAYFVTLLEIVLCVGILYFVKKYALTLMLGKLQLVSSSLPQTIRSLTYMYLLNAKSIAILAVSCFVVGASYCGFSYISSLRLEQVCSLKDVLLGLFWGNIGPQTYSGPSLLLRMPRINFLWIFLVAISFAPSVLIRKQRYAQLAIRSKTIVRLKLVECISLLSIALLQLAALVLGVVFVALLVRMPFDLSSTQALQYLTFSPKIPEAIVMRVAALLIIQSVVVLLSGLIWSFTMGELIDPVFSYLICLGIYAISIFVILPNSPGDCAMIVRSFENYGDTLHLHDGQIQVCFIYAVLGALGIILSCYLSKSKSLIG